MANEMANDLIFAARNGDIENVERLIDSGVDPNHDNDGYTALIMASDHGHTDIVRLLLDEDDTDPNIGDNDGYTALIMASDHGHTDIVRLLLDEDDTDPNIGDNHDWTALMIASQSHNRTTDIVRLLLEHNVEVNIQGSYGNTALIEASIEGHIDIVKLLLDHGADPDIRDNDGDTALDWAKEEGHTDIVNLLDPDDEDIDPFDELSDPDINLMKDEAARHIQTIMRARFDVDNKRKLTKRRYGTWASPKTDVEKDRRYMDLIRQFNEEDPIRGYERYSIYPERLLPPKKGGKRNRKYYTRKRY